MNIIEFKNSITEAIDFGKSWREILLQFKEAGGTRSEALEILEEIRKDIESSKEDDLLDIMDVASGFVPLI